MKEGHIEAQAAAQPNVFLSELINRWSGDTLPTHAMVRYTLAVGVQPAAFKKALTPLKAISHAFGRRAWIAPAIIQDHELEEIGIYHGANADTGQHEVKIDPAQKRKILGGPHVVFAVETDAAEINSANSRAVETLDALEAIARLNLGARAAIDTRRTYVLDLTTGQESLYFDGFQLYGPEEGPRIDALSVGETIALTEAVNLLEPERVAKLALALRWANTGLNTADVVAFWIAYEILCGEGVNRIAHGLARAYGAKENTIRPMLGLDQIYKARGARVHRGKHVHLTVEGSSYLLALFHDLSRHFAGLPCAEVAKNALCGQGVESWVRILP